VNRLFRTAAPYYARFRPAYPPELIVRLVDAAGLTEDSRVLDLGCGPGTVAIPLAAYAGEVVAVDVEPEMIAELRRSAPANVTVVEGRAEEIDETWGSFRLATAGRAFHWFDAELVLDRLTALTPAVALLADDMGRSEVRRHVLRLAEQLIGGPSIERPKFRYAELLAASAFSDVETLSVAVERTWTADELIGLILSTSVGSPERLGDRRPEFEERVRQELPGEYRESVRVDAVVGRRPVAAAS
jgi:SAM-dependent methyltransferase